MTHCTPMPSQHSNGQAVGGSVGQAATVRSGGPLGVRADPPRLLLDTLTKFAATSSPEVASRLKIREGRWVALYECRDALRGQVDDKGEPFRTVRCMRHLLDGESFVEVMRWDAEQKARYGRQMRVCGSVWSCPICSANIAEGRRGEVERALKVARSRGYTVLMVTRTVRHLSSWTLRWFLERFLAAERAMGKDGSYRRLLARLGVVGTLRVLEVTWGEQSGWHVHTHSLMFLDRDAGDLAAVKAELFAAWRAAAGSQRLATSPDAFVVQATWGAVDEYVAKWGREPIRRPWGVEDEMTKAGVKVARREGRYSPFGLARDHPERFLEYARAFKGRQQMRWSPGLRRHLLPDEDERSDLQLAMAPAPEYVPWGLLSLDEVRAVDYARLHHRVMSLAGAGDREGFARLVECLHGRYAWLSSDHDVGGAADPDPPASDLGPFGDLPF